MHRTKCVVWRNISLPWFQRALPVSRTARFSSSPLLPLLIFLSSRLDEERKSCRFEISNHTCPVQCDIFDSRNNKDDPPPSPALFYTTGLHLEPMKVGFAVEFEVMSEDSDRSDLFGRAISLNGGLLLAGAPKKHLDVPEIQLVVSTGTASEVLRNKYCIQFTAYSGLTQVA